MNTNWKALIIVGILSGITAVVGYRLLSGNSGETIIIKEASAGESLGRFASVPPAAGVDFTYAAELTTPMVVHIKSSVTRQSRGRQSQMPDFFRDFFGDGFGEMQQRPAEATGSGVIISPDGHIVTNNHVIEGASEIEVSLNNKTKLTAKLVGTDPSTDIAVIKVDAKDLPSITFANSETVKVGEWVVAVGNPFNLESTVTAGIVSAKGRGLGIIGQEYARKYGRDAFGVGADRDTPLESFIQTDAVVNPGNSGGALVNLRGELIGINTAIASPTGSFAGYAFAVPSSIVKKVAADIVKFGSVQRGYLGVALEELDSKKADELGLKSNEGVYVRGYSGNSAAKAAGVKEGDVIVKVDGQNVNTVPELQKAIGLHGPGDKVVITVNREGKERNIPVTLNNRVGEAEVIANDANVAMDALGADLQELNTTEKQRLSRYKIEGGVKVVSVKGGKLARTGVEEGFIITKVNGKPVKSLKEFRDTMSGKTNSMVQFEGLYPDAPYDLYTFGFRL
jgi:Do/DeqQ family serine protease